MTGQVPGFARPQYVTFVTTMSDKRHSLEVRRKGKMLKSHLVRTWYRDSRCAEFSCIGRRCLRT